MSQLENLSLTEKHEYEKTVSHYNEALRRTADRAHILRFVILRRAKQATKRFLNLIKNIKNDARINRAYSAARERILLIDLSKRWPEYFEFIHNFSGLPVASEANDFTSSYVSPVNDIIYRKILKQIRKKPPRHMLADNTYERYVELMDQDREYFEGLKKKDKTTKKRRSLQSLYVGEKIGTNIDGKNADFIEKMELVNNVEWTDFFFASSSEDEDQDQDLSLSRSWSLDEEPTTTFEICTRSLLEELVMLRKVEGSQQHRKTVKDSFTSKISPSEMSESNQTKEDMEFLAKYGTPDAGKIIKDKLPEYFQNI